MKHIAFPVVLFRHPEIQVEKGICYGESDIQLCPEWELQIKSWGPIAKKASLSGLYSSPLQRCALPAKWLAQKLGIHSVTDSRLKEMNFGQWEGKAWDNISRSSIEAWASNPWGFSPPDGENAREVYERVLSFWREILIKQQAVGIITHGGVLRFLTQLADGTPPDCLAPSPPLGSVLVKYIKKKDL